MGPIGRFAGLSEDPNKINKDVWAAPQCARPTAKHEIASHESESHLDMRIC